MSLKNIYKAHIQGENTEQTLIIFAAISVFLPYVVTAAVLIFTVARALIVKDVRKTLFKSFDMKLVLAFFVLNLLAPILYKNYLGVACFLGVTGILIFGIYAKSYMTAPLFSKISNAIAFMSIPPVFVAVLQRILTKERAASIFFNPNYYGAVITLVFLLCLYRIIVGDANKILMALVMALNVVGLLMADCQTAFGAIAVGTYILLLLNKKYKVTVVITFLGLAALPFAGLILPRLGGAAQNISIRAGIWNAGIQSFFKTPFFGRGMMGYMQIYEIYGSQKNFHCHNLLIDVLHSFGVVGAAPLVWYAVKNVAATKGKKYASLIFAAVGAVLLHGLVDVTIGWIQTGALAALLLSAGNIQKDKA